MNGSVPRASSALFFSLLLCMSVITGCMKAMLLSRVGGWKDVKEGTILSRSSLFRAPTPPRLLSYAYILAPT